MNNPRAQGAYGVAWGAARGLFQLNDRLIRFDVVAFIDQDRRDFSVNRCRYTAFHFHRFNRHQGVTALDSLTGFDGYGHNRSWHGGTNVRWVVNVCLGALASCLRLRHACFFNAHQSRLAVEFKKEFFGVTLIIHNKGLAYPGGRGPDDWHYRLAPEFVAPQGRYDWLNKHLFLSTLTEAPPAMRLARGPKQNDRLIQVYRVL